MEDSRNTRVNVLLVEDDRIDQMAFERLVKDEGLSWDYAIAGSLAEAGKLLDNDDFDCVIADFSLGDGTALDVLHLAKAAPVIITTGSGDEEVAVKAMKAGAYDYLIKDPQRNYLTVLPVTVENAIKHKAQEKRLGMLSHAMMNISDSVYIADMDNKIVFVNNAFCNTYGYEEEEIIGSPLKTLCKEEVVSESDKHGLPRSLESDGANEIYHKRKDASVFPVSLTRSIISIGTGNSVDVVVARDLTERKRSEEERLKREKLEGVVEMAGAICHELNQPMQAVSGYSEMLMQEISKENPVKRDVTKIREQIKRMGKITKKLMGITKYETKDYVFKGKRIIDIDKASVVGKLGSVADIS